MGTLVVKGLKSAKSLRIIEDNPSLRNCSSQLEPSKFDLYNTRISGGFDLRKESHSTKREEGP